MKIGSRANFWALSWGLVGDFGSLERCFLVKILLKSILYRFLSSTWGHVGAMLRPFRLIFELKGGILFWRRFEVDFCAVSEPPGHSKMSVLFRRESNFQLFVKFRWDIDFWPISGPKMTKIDTKRVRNRNLAQDNQEAKWSEVTAQLDAQREVVQTEVGALPP